MLVDGVPAKHPRRTLTLVSCRRWENVPYLTSRSIDSKNAPEPGEQAILCKGGIHDYVESLC